MEKIVFFIYLLFTFWDPTCWARANSSLDSSSPRSLGRWLFYFGKEDPDPLSTIFFSAWSAPFGNPSDSRAPRCQSPPVRSLSANSRGSRYDPLSRSRYPVLREAVWCKTPAALSRPPPATRSRQARAARFWRSRNSIFPWTRSPSPAIAP